MGGKNSVNNRCRIAKYFRRNEIEVAPISSALLRIACLVILYKTCRSLPGLRLNEHLAHDGESVFRHACKMGLAVFAVPESRIELTANPLEQHLDTEREAARLPSSSGQPKFVRNNS